MKCTHPDHNDNETCENRAVGCHPDCLCCIVPHPTITNAQAIATKAHKDQKRKWGLQEPYIIHPQWCANKAKEVGLTIIQQATMWLHDVIEDIALPHNDVIYWENQILNGCGAEVLSLCWELTNRSDLPEWIDKQPLGPIRREAKWKANLEHLKSVSDIAKQCKMIDRIHNVQSMVDAPYKMKLKYIPESHQLLEVCAYTHPLLANELETSINNLELSVK